ncbi:MAG: exosortase-associated EpsI family protein [Planctomycetota bacterium]|jgi:hypothetical protein
MLLRGAQGVTKGSENVEHGRHRVAALVALALLVASGVAYRAVVWRVAEFFAIEPIPPGALAVLPRQIGDWTGHDEPLDERTVVVVDADDHLARVYTSDDGEVASLFIALRRRDVAFGVPASALVPHRPEVCYPAHGWTAGETFTAELEAADGSPSPVKIYRFERGELERERVVVLAYYIVDGRRGHSPAQLRASGWRPKGDVRYVAQIEIACNERVFGRPAEELIRAFAADSAADILTLITGVVGRANALNGQSTD